MAEPLEFDSYFRENYPRLVSELDFVLGDPALARDIAQDAFIRQYMDWSKLSKYDKPAAWARKIALRMAFRARRHFFRNTRLDDALHIAAPDPNSPRTLDVRAAIKALSPRQRTAIILHYYRDLSTTEVADAMGCKEATARAHLFSARARLAEILADYRP